MSERPGMAGISGERVSPLLVGLLSPDYGRQLWAFSRVRKPHRCHGCDARIEGGKAWRPITNANNRMHRICDPCMQTVA